MADAPSAGRARGALPAQETITLFTSQAADEPFEFEPDPDASLLGCAVLAFTSTIMWAAFFCWWFS